LRNISGPFGRPLSTLAVPEKPGVREEVVLELLDEDYDEVHHHPWRYWHPPRIAVYLLFLTLRKL
jgi:hypothetical protein